MANDTATLQQTEFVFRRLGETLPRGSREIHPGAWLAILIPVLLAGLAYVIWMYMRERRTIGRAWAGGLATVRSIVYLLLGGMFLLPALQVWDTAEKRSRVIVLLDVSGSMNTQDDPPSESMPVEKIPSRQDKVIRFLTDEQIGFLKKLQAKNPITVYRFGGVMDESPVQFDGGRNWTANQWTAWLKPGTESKPPDHPENGEQSSKRREQELNHLLVDGTDPGEALLSVINRESNQMLQGIVLISDGRATRYSDQTIGELRARADRLKVPLFTVAVGESRPVARIRITDLQAPEQARPDDRFPVRVQVDGEGLAGQPANVTLKVVKPNGERLTLQPKGKTSSPLLFKPGEPPHAQAEFEIDKPEIEGEWKMTAHVPRDPHEIFLGKEHVSEAVTVHVVKKPLRVLLFAGGPMRDYQFVRSLFVREMDQRRAEVSIYIQLARPDIVQDVPAERLLHHFPNRFRATDSPDESSEDRYYNLGQYDLIIAFDPDWSQLTSEQLDLLEKWVGTHAGGLILVAGPVNTFQLARTANSDKVKPILDLYPVILEDSRLQGLGVERPTADPWRLEFPGATADMEFLKLDEESKQPLGGWEAFFSGQDGAGDNRGAPLRHGFYDYYPVRGVKPNATVIATLADPRARLSTGQQQPYFVSMPYGNGKVVYLSSAELWRLRQHRIAYFERFWTKLARYVGSGNMTRISKHGEIVMGSAFKANQLVPVTAQLFDNDMQPLGKASKPVMQIKGPPGSNVPGRVELQPRPAAGGDEGGWFETRFQVTVPGNYELQLAVPGTSEILSRKFTVKEANPELDNTRPDFAFMHALASEASGVLTRVDTDVRQRLIPELGRSSRSIFTGKSAAPMARLYFDLQGAHLIPECMLTERKTERNRGPVRDLWDEGPVVKNAEPPRKLSLLLLVLVGLLSLEWLVRKLLKIA